MKDLLEEKIKKDFQDYTDLEILIKEAGQRLQDNKEQIKKGTLEDVEKKIDFYKNFYIDYTFYISDLKVIFNRMFLMIDLYKDLNFSDLPEEITTFYNTNRTFAPRQMFVIKEGKLIEKEEGTLEKERQNFLESDFLKGLMEKVK